MLRLALYSLIVFVLTVIPSNRLPGAQITNLDKLVHFLEFAPLAYFAVRAFGKTYRGLFYCTAFAIGMEAIQYFLPYRQFAWTDMAFNLIGTLAGAFVCRIVHQPIHAAHS